MSHHKSSENFEFPGIFEGNHVTTTTMTALVIVVIDENKSGHGSHVAPCRTNRFEVAERMGIFSNAEAVFKLGYTTNTGVFASCDWFSTLLGDSLMLTPELILEASSRDHPQKLGIPAKSGT